MRSPQSLYLAWLFVLSLMGLAPAWAETVNFQTQLSGTGINMVGTDEKGETYFYTNWTGRITVTINATDQIAALSVDGGWSGYADTEQVTRLLVPNAPPSTYTLRVQGGGFDAAAINITPPAGYTILVNGQSSTGIQLGVTGSIDQTFTVTLFAPSGGVPPGGGGNGGGGTINLPAPETPGYLLNLSTTFTGTTNTYWGWNETKPGEFDYYEYQVSSGSFTATLNNATAGGDLASGSTFSNGVATLLQPGKAYKLSVSGNGFTNGEIVLSPPAGFNVWVNGVPTTRLRYAGPGVTGFYTVILLPEGGTFSGPAGASSSLQGGSIGWEVALGSLRNGGSAGSLMLTDHGLSPAWTSFFTPAALSYNATSPEVRLYRENGALRQVASNEAFIDIVTLDATSYELRFYPPISPSATGFQTPTGTPFVTYRIARDSSDTHLRITRITAGRTDLTTLQRTGSYPNYTWNLSDWTREDSVAAPPTRERRVWVGQANGGYIETQQLLNESGTVVRETRTTHAQFAWGLAPVQSLVGGVSAGASALLSDTLYYTEASNYTRYSQPRYTLSTGGSWVAYDYTEPTGNLGLGTVKKTYTPFLDAPASNPSGTPPADTEGVISSFTYTTDAFGDLRRLSGSQTQVKGILAAKTSITYSTASANGQRLLIATRYDRASASETDNLVSNTTVYDVVSSDPGPDTLGTLTDAFLRDQVHSTTSPTGVRQSYIRHRGNWVNNAFTPVGNGPASRIGVIQGLASPTTGSTALSSVDSYTIEPVHVVPGKSTLSYTYRDSAARVVRTESYVWNGSWSLLDWTSFTYDTAGQLTQRTTSRGEVEDRQYTGLLLTQTTDAAGTVTTYSYDAAGRVSTTTREAYSDQPAVVTTTTYDAADQVTRTELSSPSANGEKLVSTRSYDLLGRPLTEQSPGVGVTSYSYDGPSRSQTVTRPDLTYQTTTAYLDGQTYSVTGTASPASYTTYGIDADGRRWTKVNLATPDSPRWQKAWTDMLGRAARSERPGFTGQPVYVETQTYAPGTGLLLRTDRPGTSLAATLYTYDAFGSQLRSGLDLNTNNVLDLDGPDRVSGSESWFAFEEGAWWAATRKFSYLKTSSADETTVGQTRERLTGFPVPGNPLLRAESRATDVEGNTATSTTQVDRAARTVRTANQSPGLALPAVSLAVNGRAVSATAPDGLSSTTGYDALGRPKTSTDPRTGTYTTTYYPGTTLVYTQADATGTVVATHTYDNSGRTLSTTDALGKSSRYSYHAYGPVSRQWGHTVTPVAYTYDTYGQRTEQRTYRNGSGWDGDSWPAATGLDDLTIWTYDGPSGLLQKKTDSANRFVAYTYNNRGQPLTRAWARTLDGTVNGTPVTAIYAYDSATADPLGVSYNDNTTPGTSLTARDRNGRPLARSDATGSRAYTYHSTQPWRFTGETLSAFFGGRILSPVYYDGTTDHGGEWGPHIQSAVKGASWGYRLGNTADLSGDLEVLYPMANTGRLAGIHSKTGGGTGGGFDGGLGGFLYTYTTNSRLLASLQLPSVVYAQNRGYEAQRDLLTSLTATWGTEPAPRLSSTYTYNPLGQRTRHQQGGVLTTADYGDLLTTDYAYDARHELIAATTYLGANATPAATLPGRDFAYGYDTMGNRRWSTTRAAEPARTETYDTNSLNQYTGRDHKGVGYSGLAATTAKVAVDGRLAQRQGAYFWEEATRTGAAAVYPVAVAAAIPGTGGTADRAQTETRFALFPGARETFAYDADGNLTADATWTYTYDAENRLIRQEQKAWTIQPGAPSAKRLDYTYDYQGRRVRKVVYQWLGAWSLLRDTRFIYDGWNLIAEINGSTSLLRSYTWGLDLVGSRTASGGVGALVQIRDHQNDKRYLPAYDGNGNVAALFDTSGATVARYEYSPFGEVLRASGSAAKVNPFRFSTKYTDDETGLVYYGYRYYDAKNGRFINRDPIEERGGINLYGFCGNDGINQYDYLGQKSIFKRLQKWMGKNQWAGVVAAVALAAWGGWAITSMVGNSMVATAQAGTLMTTTGGSFTAFGTTVSGISATTASFGTAFAAPTLTGGFALTGLGTATAAAAGGAVGGFIGGAVSAGLTGGNAIKSGLVGAAVGGISGGLLHGLNYGARVAGHAALGGAASVAQGGKFGPGALASGLTTGLGVGNISQNGWLNTLASSAVGGAISEISGGSFAHGALTSGLQGAFNDNATWWNPITWSMNDWVDASYAAQAGVSGYVNRLTFGLSGTDGWDTIDPDSYRTGQFIGDRTNETLAVANATVGIAESAPAIGNALFARGTGLLNSNDFIRIGWNWKGSATAGSEVFRLAIGNKRSWIHWHYP